MFDTTSGLGEEAYRNSSYLDFGKKKYLAIFMEHPQFWSKYHIVTKVYINFEKKKN